MRAIHLHPKDPVAIITGDVAQGDMVSYDNKQLIAREAVGRYHKIAIVALKKGELVLRYGAPIGKATRDIEPGEWVHVHNIESTYLPTYTREA